MYYPMTTNPYFSIFSSFILCTKYFWFSLSIYWVYLPPHIFVDHRSSSILSVTYFLHQVIFYQWSYILWPLIASITSIGCSILTVYNFQIWKGVFSWSTGISMSPMWNINHVFTHQQHSPSTRSLFVLIVILFFIFP